MIVLKSNRSSTNPNLPVFELSELEMAILRMKPTCWIDTTKGVAKTTSGVVTAVRDRTGKTTWRTSVGNAPTIKEYNGIPTLHFGLSAANSGALMGELNYEALPEDGTYTLMVVYRIPLHGTEGYSGVGGNIAGNNEAVGEWLRVRFGQDSYQGNAIWINHGGTNVTPSNYPINGSMEFRDAQWHTLEISASLSGHSWVVDGEVVQSNNNPTKQFPTTASRQFIIGGATNPLSNGFKGDIAAVMLFPRGLSDNEKVTVGGYLNDKRDSLI